MKNKNDVPISGDKKTGESSSHVKGVKKRGKERVWNKAVEKGDCPEGSG